MSNKRQRELNDLCELTALPTAAGREHRVIAWVRRWADRRKHIRWREDEHGNVMLAREGSQSRKPIILAAHMDHPSFVVTGVREKEVEAVFRGGVLREFFKAGTPLALHHGDAPAQRGKLVRVEEPTSRRELPAVASFPEAVRAAKGDVLRWALPAPRIVKNHLYAPACDDLAAVAAALSALDRIARRREPTDVRVLLTRAEEIGFIGAMGACRSGFIPQRSRVIVLENSKSFADSPLGGGPIVRVGDRTSTFDPDLTYRVGLVAAHLAEQDEAFRWQRKLMPGGTCEASAYQALGYSATCVCLPLLNYHNMNERTGRIDSECIDLDDYDGMVRLLVALGEGLDAKGYATPLKQTLNARYRQGRKVLYE